MSNPTDLIDVTDQLDIHTLADTYPQAYKLAAANFGFPDLSLGQLMETLAQPETDPDGDAWEGSVEAQLERQIAQEVRAHIG